MADNTYDWEYWRDESGRFVYCSPSCQRITGRAPDEFLADASLLESIIHPEDRDAASRHLQDRFDFDPFAGRKLYSYLYDIGCEEIEVDLTAHHLIYGKLKEHDLFNWTCKMEAAKPLFDSEETYRQFFDEFMRFFTDSRRFTYTPLIACKGKKQKSL